MTKFKKYITIVVAIIISIFSTLPVYAKVYSVNNYSTIEIEGRVRKVRKAWFQSYLPQYYQGLTLKKIQKVSNGYWGFYV